MTSLPTLITATGRLVDLKPHTTNVLFVLVFCQPISAAEHIHCLTEKVFAVRRIQCLRRHGLSGLRLEPLPLKDGKATESSAAAAGAGKTREAYGFYGGT